MAKPAPVTPLRRGRKGRPAPAASRGPALLVILIAVVLPLLHVRSLPGGSRSLSVVRASTGELEAYLPLAIKRLEVSDLPRPATAPPTPTASTTPLATRTSTVTSTVTPSASPTPSTTASATAQPPTAAPTATDTPESAVPVTILAGASGYLAPDSESDVDYFYDSSPGAYLGSLYRGAVLAAHVARLPDGRVLFFAPGALGVPYGNRFAYGADPPWRSHRIVDSAASPTGRVVGLVAGDATVASDILGSCLFHNGRDVHLALSFTVEPLSPTQPPPSPTAAFTGYVYLEQYERSILDGKESAERIAAIGEDEDGLYLQVYHRGRTETERIYQAASTANISLQLQDNGRTVIAVGKNEQGETIEDKLSTCFFYRLFFSDQSSCPREPQKCSSEALLKFMLDSLGADIPMTFYHNTENPEFRVHYPVRQLFDRDGQSRQTPVEPLYSTVVDIYRKRGR